jgi:hypothetical protein
MRVRAGSPAYNTYLKFNVTGLSGTVQNATLRLFVTDGGDRGGAVYQASGSYRNTSTPWGQGGLTWNNAPALMGMPLVSAGPVASNTWIELDVTAAIGGNGTCSLGLTTASSNSVYFCTKEGSNPPQLVITFVPSEVTSAGSDD